MTKVREPEKKMFENLKRETGIFEASQLQDEPREECGVFGMYDFSGEENVAPSIYYGLLALQHRGQESCGIAVSDTTGPKGKVISRKGMGLVNENFEEDDLAALRGDIGVGHVRYSTSGASTIENAQPLVLHYIKGTLAMAHNGNLVNSPQLMKELSRTGAIFQTTTDSELIAYEIARARIQTGSVEEAVSMAMDRIRGSYSLIVMSPRKLIGVRDTFGFRPPCIGRGGKAWFFGAESCGLGTIGAEFVRDVEPGEIVTISPRFGLHSDRSHCIRSSKTARCIFEYIYFGRADSVLDRVSVYNARIQAGKYLAQDSPADADLVIGVPESGTAAALGFSMESGIPYGQGFVKNSYVGRTFIKPEQHSRESAVRVKLNPLRPAVEGKRIVMIDDSIVRGTTSDRVVRVLREAGAREFHMSVSAPPFLYPCYFGTDIPEREQLIAYHHSLEDIRLMIGADSLAYLKMERLTQMVGGLPICCGCFSGTYPIDPPTEDIRGEHEG